MLQHNKSSYEDINGFREYVAQVAHVDQEHYFFYIRWVNMAFDHAGKKLGTPLTNQEIDAFINRFKHEHESWQVKQARYAISLYHHFLSNDTIQNGNLSHSYDQKWAVVADRMKNCMHLQHKAYKTEQASPATEYHSQNSAINNFCTHLWT